MEKKHTPHIENHGCCHNHDHHHNHHHGHNHGHNHNHDYVFLNILGKKTDLYFAIFSGIFWFVGLGFSLFTNLSTISLSFYIIACLFGGIFTFYSAIDGVLKGHFEIDFLMLFAAIGAAILGKWGESSLLLFLFSLGHALEHYAMGKARKSITALSQLAPPKAFVRKENSLVEVPIEELRKGDIIVVKPNSKIAADGIVIKGISSVNQAAITGESMPVTKYPAPGWENIHDIKKIIPKHHVFSGTINGNEVIEVKVLKEANDSTLSKLIYLVKQAEAQKSPTQHLADNFEKYYVPIILILVAILHFAFLVIDESFQDSFYRAMSVLIAASPCALAISTPSTVLAGIARAAQKGVLFKGGGPLEDLGKINAIAFDKTGTLTMGKPTLTHAIPFGNKTKEHLLTVAMAVESLSDHPLASAIVADCEKELNNATSIAEAENLMAITAKGVRANYQGSVIHIGNRQLLKEVTGQPIPMEIETKMKKLESEGQTVMIVHQDNDYLGLIAVMDTPRPEAIKTIHDLSKMDIQLIMLTGDNQKVADAIAHKIGLTQALGELLPEDKVKSIETLSENGKVAMVGDGVNDAPAMAKSSIGIAMGAAGSDVALETADIALMGDQLETLPFAIGLSRKAKQIIKENLIISLGMVAILVPLTIFSFIPIGPAVVGHEGSTIIVVLNALRLLKYNHS